MLCIRWRRGRFVHGVVLRPACMHDGYNPDLLDHEYQTENTVDGNKKDGLH